MTALIELKTVTKVFGGGIFHKNATVALQDLSMSISGDSPAITAIAGESGSGKTTLAKLIMGVLAPTSGQVLYKGKNLEKMSREERKEFQREVQPIFQDPFEVYNPFYKVDHVLNTPVANFHLASSKAEAKKLVQEALEVVGLRPEETLGRHPHQLSGGQRQRVMVARALLLKPLIILADEPVSMVDASLRATILESLRKMNRELGISVLYITHDLTTAYQIADNIVILYQGSVAEAGSVEEVIKTPQHPYTRLLVESIPVANPKTKWGGEVATSAGTDSSGKPVVGCKFAPRCPYAMDICWQKPPPFYQTHPHRVVNCYLYKDSPSLTSPDVAQVFATTAAKPA